MVHAKSKKAVGLGNTLMNDRFGRGRGNERKKTTAVIRVQKDTGEQYVTNDRPEASYVKMRSVTEQGALDEFLATAELAGTDFTAEKMNNVKIIHTDQRNPYLLSASEEKAVLGKQRENKAKLTVPRRPQWDSNTTAEELDRAERESFLQWRRGLAEMQESQDLLMTPFERNLEVWRQLWRVIERSDVIVQIVDARNPLLFRSEDLEQYVKDVDPKKQNLLLINKADMMTYNQRKAWSSYLKGAGISYKFFSAQLAKEQIEADELEQNSEEEDEESEEEGSSQPKGKAPAAEEEESSEEESSEDDSEGEEEEDADTRILTIGELESIFLKYAPQYGAGMSTDAFELYSQTNSYSQVPTGNSRLVSSDTPTSESRPRSTPSSVLQKCPSPQPPERQSTSRPSTSATRSSFAIAPVSCSPTLPTPRPSWSATVFSPSISSASTPVPSAS